MSPEQMKDLQRAFRSWNAIERSAGRVYADPIDAPAIIERAQKYASVESLSELGALSAFSRALMELAKEGAVKAKRPIPVKAAIPADFEDLVTRQLTPTELRVKLERDAEFRNLYGRWSAGEKPEGYAQTHTGRYDTFSAKDWRSVSPNVLAKLMLQPDFRARVDQLVAEGGI